MSESLTYQLYNDRLTEILIKIIEYVDTLLIVLNKYSNAHVYKIKISVLSK